MKNSAINTGRNHRDMLLNVAREAALEGNYLQLAERITPAFVDMVYSDYATPYSVIVAASRPEFDYIVMTTAYCVSDYDKTWPMCETIKPARPAKAFYQNLVAKAVRMAPATVAKPYDEFRYDKDLLGMLDIKCDPTSINWDAFHLVVNLVAYIWSDEGCAQMLEFEGSCGCFNATSYELLIAVDGCKRVACLATIVSAMTGIPEGDLASEFFGMLLERHKHEWVPACWSSHGWDHDEWQSSFALLRNEQEV